MSGLRRAIAVVGIALAGLVIGALPASADAGDPPIEPGPEWTLTSSREDPGTVSARCSTGSEWVWSDGDREVTLLTVPCTRDAASSGMYEWLAPEGEIVRGAGQRDEVVLWAQDRVVRAWVADGPGDESAFAMVTVTCAGADRDSCIAESDSLARRFMQATPGGLDGVDAPGFTSETIVIGLIVPLVLIAIVLAPIRLVAALVRPRYMSSSTSTRYHDVSRAVVKARWLRRIRRGTWGVILFLVAVVLVTSITTGDGNGLVGGLVLVAVALIPLVIGYRTFLRPSPVERGRRNVSGQGVEAGLGAMLSVLAYALVGLVMILYVLVSNYSTMLSGWPSLTSADARRMDLPLLASVRSLVLFMGTEGMIGATVLVIPVLIAVSMVDALGQRLRTASLDEALAQDTRPHYLYLRSFDEDKLSLNGQLRKRSLISALSLRRKVRFEEVLVRQLSATGPVIAIAPPGSNMPPIGAARASFSNDEWQQHVHRYAESARAVVLSATPGEIRQGYGWELDLIANRISHQRVLVVLGPWPLRSLRWRWTQFCTAVSAVPFFAPITMPWVPDGIHVLAHSPQQGWQGWGATRRIDWTYAVAIDQATRAYLPDWS